MRLPRGPTLHFKVEDFSLVNDVLSVMKKKYNHKKQYLHQPLLILNGFNSKVADSNIPHIEPHLKLLTTTLQNMFPSINVTKVSLNYNNSLIKTK
jgi:ribosome biogenesis protein SSF1/2